VARVWSTATGQELLTLSGHTNALWAIAHSPDGARIATGHASGIYGIAFSPDGKRLATASSDGTARVYTLRVEDLIALGGSRLTRFWTLDECQQFLLRRCLPRLR
jgi:WD40 repeat protein